MNVTLNYPKDKNILEDNIAYIRAMLMKKYIEDLNVVEEQKNIIKNDLIKELQKT